MSIESAKGGQERKGRIMIDPSKERRFKKLLISDEIIWSLIHGMLRRWPQFLDLADMRGLPDDVEIVNIYYEIMDKSFVFLLAHESFDKCPPNVLIPFIGLDEKIVIDLKQYKKID